MTVTPYARPTDELAPLVGKATIAWNDMQFAILSIFFTILPCPRDLSEALFFSLNSDRSQRALVKAAVQHSVTPLYPDLAKQVLAEIKKLDGNESGRRNAAIHAMWMIEIPSLEPTIYQDNMLAKKGGAAEIKKELEAMIEEFNRTAIRLFDLRRELWLKKEFRNSGEQTIPRE